MNGWTYEQQLAIEKYAREHGVDHEQAIKALNGIKDIFESIKEIVYKFLKQLRPYLESYKRYCHEQNVKFFKKKKSQRKNWSKWKKRTRR